MSDYFDDLYCGNCKKETRHAMLDNTPEHYVYTKVCSECNKATCLEDYSIDADRAVKQARELAKFMRKYRGKN